MFRCVWVVCVFFISFFSLVCCECARVLRSRARINLPVITIIIDAFVRAMRASVSVPYVFCVSVFYV